MSPIVNPDTSQAQELTAIEPGTYKAKITAVESKTAEKSGNPMIVVSFDVDVAGKNRGRKAYLVIVGEGAFGFDQLLRSTGFTELADKYKAGQQVPFDTDQLVGQELNVVIESDTYQGQLRDKIRSFLKA